MMSNEFQAGASEPYFRIMRERPELFHNGDASGIEVLTSPDAIRAAQESARDIRQKRGLDVSDLRVGVLASDPYMLILRDAVRFVDGSLGLYNRIVEVPSVAVLPLLDGRPVLIKIFRHGLRDWCWEFPRGGRDRGEPSEASVRRELREEIGAEIRDLVALGDFTPGGSSLSIRADLYAAHIDRVGEPEHADNISEVRVVEVGECEALIRSSQIIDGFSLALFLRARLAGLV
jgi:ADP-ribose pyrophosphatase